MAPTQWYVIQTKRHREEFAQVSLAERGMSTYLPRIVQWPRPAVGSDIAPMFPSYLFVKLVLPQDFYRVSWTPGVKALVSFGGGPASVDEAAIEILRGREGPDGLIHYDDRPRPNSAVRIVNGPFRGLTAVLEERLPARERVRVLMRVLHRETPVELPETWIRQA